MIDGIPGIRSGGIRTEETSAPPVAVAGAPPTTKLDLLIHRIAAAPWKFDFFSALRMLENTVPHVARIGHSQKASEDPARFGQEASLAFAPATLTACRYTGENSKPLLLVRFMGLCGPFGPLPPHLTEYVRDRQRNFGDATPARFFDIFNHRMISLFYRAWAANQQAVSYERNHLDDTGPGPARGDSDRISVFVGSLFGQGTPAFRRRDAAPDHGKLHFSGRLALQCKNAEGLAAILRDFFAVEVGIEQFVGHWVTIPEQSWCRLGESRASGQLGTNIVVGKQIWDYQQKFRIRMGPMNFREYCKLLPGGKSLKKLTAWVRNYIGFEFSWDVQLVLKAGEIPAARLGQVGQLGWSAWLCNKPLKRNADDLILQPTAA